MYKKIKEIFNDQRDYTLEPFGEKESIQEILKKGLTPEFLTDVCFQFPLLEKQIPWLLKTVEKELTFELKNQEQIDVQRSECLLYLVEVFLLGRDILGSDQKFIDWLACRPPVFKNYRPIDYLSQQKDKIQYVRDTLCRIAHGNFA